MSYDCTFFDEYKSYLQEPQVRQAHGFMLLNFNNMFPKWKHPLNIIEFGCGQGEEYNKYGYYSEYAGLDLNPPKKAGYFQCDYTKLNGADIKKLVPFACHAFVSLFSTECCMDHAEKYAFYRMIFRETDIQMGLVSGFYYRSKVKQKKVEETGGIVSYQSVENQKDYQCPEFIEMRTYIDVPSKMFGPDVVEVWKVLKRYGN